MPVGKQTGIRDAVREALKRLAGLKTSELHGYTIQQVGHAVSHLCEMDPPQAFAARLSHRDVRYFDTEPRAKAFESLHKHPITQKQARLADNLASGKRLDEQRVARKAGAKINPVGMDDAPRTVDLWDESKGRYWVSPTVRGEFSAIPLGGTLP